MKISKLPPDQLETLLLCRMVDIKATRIIVTDKEALKITSECNETRIH